MGRLWPRAAVQSSMPRVAADLSGDWLGGFSAARNLECSRLDPWRHCGLLELWRRAGAGRDDLPGVDMADGGHVVPMACPCSGWRLGAVIELFEGVSDWCDASMILVIRIARFYFRLMGNYWRNLN